MDNSVLFKIGYGLYVLTANENGKDNGCIINTVMQASSNPCQLTIAINKTNYTCGMVQRTKKFNVSVLTESANFDMFKRFGFQSGKDVDKFVGFPDVKRSPNGVLYITQNTNSFMSAYVKQEVDLGSHIVFFAQLVESVCLNEAPTLMYSYYHEHIKPKTKPTEAKGWRCKICGFIYEGEFLPQDYICPLCKHGVEDFEKI